MSMRQKTTTTPRNGFVLRKLKWRAKFFVGVTGRWLYTSGRWRPNICNIKKGRALSA